jgi:PAS domain S-box-containing protein
VGTVTVSALVLAAVLAEREEAEEKTRTSENKFRQVTESIREVFWMTDVEKTRMLYISPGYEEIWGRTCASLYASPRGWVEAIHPDDRDRVLRAALTKQAEGNYD